MLDLRDLLLKSTALARVMKGVYWFFCGQNHFFLRLGQLPLNLLIFEGSHGIERHFQQKQEYSCVESFDRELGEPHGPTLRQLGYVNDWYGNKMVGHCRSISNMLDNQTKHNLTKQKQILSFICYSEFFTSEFFYANR